jgi:hypothetical protein
MLDCPMLSLTKKPIIYSRFEFGGDDLLGFYERYLPDDSPLFDERCDICNRYIDAIGNKDLEQAIEQEYEAYKSKVRDVVTDIIAEKHEEIKDKYTQEVIKLLKGQFNNEKQRLRIVEALGGEEFVKTIPVITTKVNSYPYFNVTDVPEGHSFAQFHDAAGRKGVIMKLKNKNTGNFEVAWFNQRYRETSTSGDLWLGRGACQNEGVDNIVNFIHSVKPIPHKKYEFVS